MVRVISLTPTKYVKDAVKLVNNKTLPDVQKAGLPGGAENVLLVREMFRGATHLEVACGSRRAKNLSEFMIVGAHAKKTAVLEIMLPLINDPTLRYWSNANLQREGDASSDGGFRWKQVWLYGSHGQV
jgi:hypothetical protein